MIAKKRDPRMRNVERRRHACRDGSAPRDLPRAVGRRGRRQAETFDDVERAIAFRDELEERAARLWDDPPARARTTVSEAKDLWWREHVGPRPARRTRDNYDGAWRRHVEPRVASMLLIDLTTAEIERLKDKMLADGLGAATALSFAARRNMVDFNSAIAIEKPSTRRQRRRSMPPSIEVVERFRTAAIDELNSPLTAAWCSISAYGGLRPGEVRGLLWAHVREQTLYVADNPRSRRCAHGGDQDLPRSLG